MNVYQRSLKKLDQLEKMTIVTKNKALGKKLLADLIEQLGFRAAAQAIRDGEKPKENALYASRIWERGAKLVDEKGNDVTPPERYEFYQRYAAALRRIVDEVL